MITLIIVLAFAWVLLAILSLWVVCASFKQQREYDYHNYPIYQEMIKNHINIHGEFGTGD